MVAAKNEDEPQQYDRALKALMEDHVAEMLPELVPGSIFLEEKSIEITRNSLRADLVYLIKYRGTLHILNLELQTDTDQNMAFRMLQYNIELWDKYKLPVISVVMYPFKTTIPESILEEKSGDEILLHFHHQVLCLWNLEAEAYMHKGKIGMYTLLPAMKGATTSMLIQAIEEMREQYPGKRFGRHLARFSTILQRSTTLTKQEKQTVEDYLHMYDSFIDENPDIQERVAKGEIRGKMEGQQKSIILITETRFPSLVAVAQVKVPQIHNTELLDKLTKALLTVSSEKEARLAFDFFTA